LTVGRGSEAPAVMLSYFTWAAADAVPAVPKCSKHFTALNWFESPRSHLSALHDLGPTTEPANPLCSTVVADSLKPPVGLRNSARNLCLLPRVTMPELHCFGFLFRWLAFKAKEPPRLSRAASSVKLLLRCS